MSRKIIEPRKRVGVYIEESLLQRFHSHYELGRAQYGEFTKIINELLKRHLDELDEKELAFKNQ